MNNFVQPSRWMKIIILSIAVASASVLSSAAPARDVTEVQFRVFDREGRPVSWETFRRLQENGIGVNGDNDKLLDPQDLTLLIKRRDETYGLYSSLKGNAAKDGNPTIEWPRGRKETVTLSMAWPTPEGYSTLLLDLPYPAAVPAPTYLSSKLPIYTQKGEGPPVVIFNLLAAQQVFSNLENMLSERERPPFSFPYTPSASYREAYASAYNAARDNLNSAKVEGLDEGERGKLGQRAFEAATRAMLLMLEDYGVQYARQHRATFRPQWGGDLRVGQERGRESRPG